MLLKMEQEKREKTMMTKMSREMLIEILIKKSLTTRDDRTTKVTMAAITIETMMVTESRELVVAMVVAIVTEGAKAVATTTVGVTVMTMGAKAMTKATKADIAIAVAIIGATKIEIDETIIIDSRTSTRDSTKIRSTPSPITECIIKMIPLSSVSPSMRKRPPSISKYTCSNHQGSKKEKSVHQSINERRRPR